MEVGNNISNISSNASELYRSQSITPNRIANRKLSGSKASVGQGSVASNDNDRGVQSIPDDVAKSIITEINKKISKNTTAQFSYHEKTNRVMIKILDSETNEIIKEIPPEKTLDMIAQILELVGILVDDKR